MTDVNEVNAKNMPAGPTNCWPIDFKAPPTPSELDFNWLKVWNNAGKLFCIAINPNGKSCTIKFNEVTAVLAFFDESANLLNCGDTPLTDLPRFSRFDLFCESSSISLFILAISAALVFASSIIFLLFNSLIFWVKPCIEFSGNWNALPVSFNCCSILFKLT